MLLPNNENAFIAPAKLTEYLLSETHKDGKSKAKFFRKYGFNEENVDLLEKELLNLARDREVTEIEPTEYGIKYKIVGTINTPVEKTISILTIWIINTDQDCPGFVTARPFSEKRS